MALWALAAAAPAARAATTIQPGDAFTNLSAAGGCTLDFVFAGRGKTYFGTAAHCSGPVGSRVADSEGTAFGTVAFVGHVDDVVGVDPIFDPAGAAQAVADELNPPQWTIEWDFALIRVDHEDIDRVSPAVRGHPEFPTGVTAPDDTATGGPVQVSGHPEYAEGSAAVREQRRGI